MYSFGIVLWEVLEGPGIRIPYAEYLDSMRLISIKEGIKDGSVRPTAVTQYVEDMYPHVKKLLQDCLEHHPENRPSAAVAHNRLCAMLGRRDTVKEPAILQANSKPELRQSMEVAHLLPQRQPEWTCPRCSTANFGQSVCSNGDCLHERVSSSVSIITSGGGYLWIGLRDGQVRLPNPRYFAIVFMGSPFVSLLPSTFGSLRSGVADDGGWAVCRSGTFPHRRAHLWLPLGLGQALG